MKCELENGKKCVGIVRHHALLKIEGKKKQKTGYEIQPGFEPGLLEFQSDALTESLELQHWSNGIGAEDKYISKGTVCMQVGPMEGIDSA